jgi:hypothetical protein
MKTKSEFIAQCKAENPTMVQTINDVKTVLSKAEYEAAVEAWAQMKLEQQAAEIEEAAKAKTKADLLDRLGITAEEAALLLG